MSAPSKDGRLRLLPVVVGALMAVLALTAPSALASFGFASGVDAP
jgi:hypothetical protein